MTDGEIMVHSNVECAAVAGAVTETANGWQSIETLPPPGERPGNVWVIVEGWQDHSGFSWYRQQAGLARTHNEGFEDEDIRLIEKRGGMDRFSGEVTHWMKITLPPYPERTI